MTYDYKKDIAKMGFIFIFLNKIIEVTRYLSAVEFFKFAFRKIAIYKNGNTQKYLNCAIDLFTIFKWLVVIILWSLSIKAPWASFLVMYLLVFNLHSYFYYHVWDIGYHNHGELTPARQRRRFSLLLLSFTFSICGFAYLYSVPFAENFLWKDGFSHCSAAIIFSIGNSLTGFSGPLTPNDEYSSFLATTQLIFSFIFLTIVLSQSLPQVGNKSDVPLERE